MTRAQQVADDLALIYSHLDAIEAAGHSSLPSSTPAFIRSMIGVAVDGADVADRERGCGHRLSQILADPDSIPESCEFVDTAAFALTAMRSWLDESVSEHDARPSYVLGGFGQYTVWDREDLDEDAQSASWWQRIRYRWALLRLRVALRFARWRKAPSSELEERIWAEMDERCREALDQAERDFIVGDGTGKPMGLLSILPTSATLDITTPGVEDSRG